MKPGSIVPSNIYLVVKLSKLLLPNGVEAWAVGDSKYIKDVLKCVDKCLNREGILIQKGTNSPLTNNNNITECNSTPELDS